jgi:carboxypeptidase PM20D1
LHEACVCAIGIMIGGTDSKHFGALTTNIYRFSPLLADNSDLKRFHGNDERISLSNYEQVINFYYEIFLASDSEEQVKPHSHSSDL